MVKKLKKIGIAVLCVLAGAGIIILLIMTAGKNRKIKALLNTITDTWKKNVAAKEVENEVLDEAYDALTEREKQIIEMIKKEPDLKVPDEIDPTDYKAMIKWFDNLGEEYD